MNTIFAYVMLTVVLAIVLRNMDRLTQTAAGRSLRPGTVRILRRIPMLAFALWVVTLVLRRMFQADGAMLWPFELAVAVAVWLFWIALLALAVALHDARLRLLARRRNRVPPRLSERESANHR